MARRTFKLISLMLALALMLTGCSMIEVDQEMDDSEVIIKVNDTELLKKEVMTAFDNYKANLQYQYQMYSSFGYSLTMPSDDEIKQDVVDALVIQEVRKQKAAELGLDQLTEEEKTEVQEIAKTNYDKDYASVKTNLTKDGMTDEQITAAADEYMAKYELTMDAYVENATETKIDEKLDQDIFKDLSVSDEEVKTEFDSRVAEDQTAYESDATAIDTKLNSGTAVYYYPAGYRYVKHILVKFLEDDATAISDLQKQISDVQSQIDAFATAAPTEQPAATEAPADATEQPTEAPTAEPTADPAAAPTAEPTAAPTMDPSLPTQLADLQAKLEAAQQTARANIQAKVDEVYQKATSGEDFDALIAEYGEDTGMTTEPAKTYGYVIGENVTRYVTSFHDASMALAKVGDISEPVESNFGFHIIKYVGDVTEGPATMTDDIKTSIHDSLLSDKQTAEKTAKEDEWKQAAKIETHVNQMVVYN